MQGQHEGGMIKGMPKQMDLFGGGLKRMLELAPDFDGPVYDRAIDRKRLTGQILRVYRCLAEGSWMTLSEIASATGDPEASVSAQLRHLRKERFGSHIIDKRRRGEKSSGLWEYRLRKEEA